MSTLQNSRNANEIEAHLEETLRKMVEHQERGEYMPAEEARVLSEKLKKQYEERRIYEMHRRQDQEEADLIKNY